MKKAIIITTMFLCFTTLSVAVAPSHVANAKAVTVSKKESTTEEKLIYFQKQLDKLDLELEKARSGRNRLSKSSEAYRKSLRKEIKILKEKKYWMNKIIDLL